MGGGIGSLVNFIGISYLGFVLTSYDIMSPNSDTQLHHAFLASGAPNAFFAIEIPTPSKGEHIHPIFSEDVVLYTLKGSLDLYLNF